MADELTVRTSPTPWQGRRALVTWSGLVLALAHGGCRGKTSSDTAAGGNEAVTAAASTDGAGGSGVAGESAATAAGTGIGSGIGTNSSTSSDATTGTGGFISIEAWEAMTAPYQGVHDVETRGCAAEPIDQAYKVLPLVQCYLADDYDFQTNPVRNCVLEPSCVTHADCTEKPFGRCRGVPSTECTYGIGPEPCTLDSDCTSPPGGSCGRLLSDDILCYPTGECEPPPQGAECFYRQELCTENADCDAAPDGTCLKRTLYAKCEYNDCEQDGDCPGSERCLCSELYEVNQCVVADCTSDGDCSTGETCLPEYGCFGAAAGYHCTTTDDECVEGSDCPNSACAFEAGQRICGPTCPID